MTSTCALLVFTGKTISHMLAKVLDREIDFTALPTTTPAALRRLLRRCLNKDQKHRLRDAAEAVVHLEEAGAAPTSDSGVSAASVLVAQPHRWQQVLPWVAGLALAVITGLAVWTLRPLPPLPVLRLAVSVPPSVPVSTESVWDELAVSTDGTHVVYRGGGELQVRALNQLEGALTAGNGWSEQSVSLAGWSANIRLSWQSSWTDCLFVSRDCILRASIQNVGQGCASGTTVVIRLFNGSQQVGSDLQMTASGGLSGRTIRPQEIVAIRSTRFVSRSVVDRTTGIRAFLPGTT